MPRTSRRKSPDNSRSVPSGGRPSRQPDRGFWEDRRVLVTGGASFIGSHLCDALDKLGSDLTIIDNFSSGRRTNLDGCKRPVRVIRLDLEYATDTDLKDAFADQEVVFHLAAVHGGRGYIDLHPADVASNFAIDHHVFEASSWAGAGEVVFASTACVYPPALQARVGSSRKLKETDADLSDLTKPLSADLEYGWAKLMGEVQLRAFAHQYGLKGCSVRFVTAYGPRENETHAIIALIAKALRRMDPYEIWGDGRQERDFTYVSDIVTGTLLAAERLSDGSALNLGTGHRWSLQDVAERILGLTGFRPRAIHHNRAKPTGVQSRALDITRAQQLLGWHPEVDLMTGLRRTVGWCAENLDLTGPLSDQLLVERA